MSKNRRRTNPLVSSFVHCKSIISFCISFIVYLLVNVSHLRYCLNFLVHKYAVCDRNLRFSGGRISSVVWEKFLQQIFRDQHVSVGQAPWDMKEKNGQGTKEE